MSTTESDLAALIPSWLAVTRGRQIAIGLSREEVLRRAAALRCLLRDGKVQAQDGVISEDLKDVLHALVALVTDLDPLPGPDLADEASAIFRLLSCVVWQDDASGERTDLMFHLAEKGWAALGYERPRLGLLRTSCGSEAPRRQAIHELPMDVESLSSLRDHSLGVCQVMRECRDASPGLLNERARKLYESLASRGVRFGIFDERDFLMGELAFHVGSTYRLLGNRISAEIWLERAEERFEATITAPYHLANIGYAKLTLDFDSGRCEKVLRLIPRLIVTFDQLGMRRESIKSRFLEAMSLKKAGRNADARQTLEDLKMESALASDVALRGLVLCNLGELLSADEHYREAASLLGEALTLFESVGMRWGLAQLKLVIGESLERQGVLAGAIDAYRAAVTAYVEVGMATFVAYSRLLLSEALLQAGRPAEAECEILQALPTIEEQKMVPEGFAAVALLRESVRRQKADPEALRQLREHLQRQH